MHTIIPPQTETEVLSIRFHKEFIESYLPDTFNAFDLDRPVAYEDIDETLGDALTRIVKYMDNKLACHAHLLTFLNYLFSCKGI